MLGIDQAFHIHICFSVMNQLNGGEGSLNIIFHIDQFKIADINIVFRGNCFDFRFIAY